jgi:hypothetical protein
MQSLLASRLTKEGEVRLLQDRFGLLVIIVVYYQNDSSALDAIQLKTKFILISHVPNSCNLYQGMCRTLL